MNAKDAILKIRALFEDMPVEEPKEEVKETKVEMAEYVLEDGTKVMVSELAVGGQVTLEDGSKAPDAEHKLADGSSIVTLDGVITEIKQEQPEVEVEIESKDYDKKIEEMASAYDAKINEMIEANQKLQDKVNELEAKNKEGFSLVVAMMEEFSKVPSVDPIASPKSFKFESTNDIKADRLNKYRNAILNNKN
tara:strand:+ start:26 stop:604 length:579 start_codon:yes stop_codon:yes gene_type:complete